MTSHENKELKRRLAALAFDIDNRLKKMEGKSQDLRAGIDR